MKLKNKKVIITGGASGIGKATAELFCQEGAQVAILDINKIEGEKTINKINIHEKKAFFFETNLTKSKEVKNSINKVLDQFKEINILFNHAGTIIVKPLHKSSEEDYNYLMDINVRSAFLVCNQVIPIMLKNKGGNIIITSSIGGEKGFALESLYCMTNL